VQRHKIIQKLSPTEVVGCELDKGYFDDACKRVKGANSVGKLFTPEQIYKRK
jgi:hypothetical protein